MKSFPMALDATPPYWIDVTEPQYIDEDGFTSEPIYDLPMTNGFLVRQWLEGDVLTAIRNRDVAGRVTRHGNTIEVASPAGDLQITTERLSGRVTFTQFVTAAALVGQAEMYRLYTPQPRDYDAELIFETYERSGEELTATFDEFYLYDRDPIAVRFVEIVDLIKANATPNVDPYSFVHQSAA